MGSDSKILIFGGTTEGRRAAALCDTEGRPFYYSTKSALVRRESVNAIPLSGGFDNESLIEFCNRERITLIIDAAHPFAERLHTTVFEVSKALSIPIIRYERLYPRRDREHIYVANYKEAIDTISHNGYSKVLMLTGVSSISKTKEYWKDRDNCYFRILKRGESIELAKLSGLSEDRILFYDQTHGGDITKEIEMLSPDVIVTKESGLSGFFEDKTISSKRFSLPMIVISRPELPQADFTVYGPEMLRKRIESLAPDFFSHKIGYTTGTCATAATSAAAQTLLNGVIMNSVNVSLPSGEPVELDVCIKDVKRGEDGSIIECSYAVNKFAGDDPDITDGLEIISTVKLNSGGEISFFGGEGVGRITLPGLDSAIGEAAINKTPKEMMTKEVRGLFTEGIGVDIKISVPDGERIAKKTFNPKLGIVGGISIIGTSGIVRPFSNEAFINSIRKEMEVAKALGIETLVINSGAKSENIIKALYPTLPDQAFIHYGNFIGKTLELAEEMGFREVVLGIMIGKAVKLAEGHLDTHSKNQTMNRDFIADIAREAGSPVSTIESISSITMARALYDIIPEPYREKFFELVKWRCHRIATAIFRRGEIKILILH